jgi:iron complex outermembrane recepter protein
MGKYQSLLFFLGIFLGSWATPAWAESDQVKESRSPVAPLDSRSPLAPLEKGGSRVKDPLDKGRTGLKVPLDKEKTALKVPLDKGRTGLKVPLDKERTALKVPLDKERTALKVPLDKERTALKVPLRKGDLGGSLAQNPQLTRVTGLEVRQTPAGVQVILKTPSGQAKLVPLILPEGNNLVIDLLDATLAFSIRNGVTQTNPAPGIKEVRVSKIDATSIRVTIAGEKQAPSAEIVPGSNLVLSVTPKATAQTQADEEIEIVVTGEREEGNYAVPNSSVGTRTDAAIKDVPQSIQVIPQQVLKDQAANDINDALRNVAGVTPAPTFGSPNIRGFSSTFLRDGISQSGAYGFGIDYQSNVEQVEILRGPSSVLYGSGDPGGVINLTEKQPQAQPAYELGATIGNYDFYRGTLDFTGPLDREKTVLYRLNLDYENSGSFIDFVEREDFAIFPVLSFQLGKNTKFTLDSSYQRTIAPSTVISYFGLPLEGTIRSNILGDIPRSRFLGEPDFDESIRTEWSIGSLIEHEFSENWSLRNRFRYNFSDVEEQGMTPLAAGELREDNRTLDRSINVVDITDKTYTLRTDLLGKFQTGIIEHDTLFGVELRRVEGGGKYENGESVFPIDVFNPDYGNFEVGALTTTLDDAFTEDRIGLYAQDLLSIGDKVKVLLGGRYDWQFSSSEDFLTQTSTEEDPASGFAPRVGIVYQPIESVSIYSGWSRSFVPQSEQDREGNQFVPITGDQFEVGVKTDFLGNRLTSTLAVYQITRQNDFQTDPVDPNFQIQIGEQRSRGIELDLRGELSPGLNLIASYAYTDTEITEDTTGLEGNQLGNVPQHSGNIWAVYEFQKGSLQGLGLGAGVFILGARQGDNQNTFELSTNTLTNALIYYRRDSWRAQLNFENLFDEDYFLGTENAVIPGEPFTVRGQLSAEF